MEISAPPLVYVVDDDPVIRASLEDLLSSEGYRVQKFVSGAEFLANCDSEAASCALVDMRMPGLDGLEVQEEIARRNMPTGTVIITGYADVPLAVRAINAGAIDILQKPFRKSQLLAVVTVALERARKTLGAINGQRQAKKSLSRLTLREMEVAHLISIGHTSKAVAERLFLSPRTVELHRASLMSKLQVSTLPALIKLIATANGINS